MVPVSPVRRSKTIRAGEDTPAGSAYRWVVTATPRRTRAQLGGRPARPGITDVAVAVAAAAVMIVGTLLDRRPGEHRLTVVAAFLLIGEAAPLVWRRRAPVVVLVATGVAAAAYGIAPYPDPLLHLGTLVALYTVVVSCDRRISYLAGGVTAAAIVASTAASGDANAMDYFSSLALAAVTWALAEGQRARVAYQVELKARAERLVVEREIEARRAVTDERVRIARELHDVVAHHVSMMVVQAEAGATVSATAPSQSGERFDGISATGRQALNELRRLVGVLRADDEAGPAEPQPGLDQAAALVAQVGEAGLTVSFRVEGRPRPLPAGVDLSAYRILQEALTNTVRHAGPVAASVVVRYRDDAIDLEVLDDGRGGADGLGGADDTEPSGHGLIGIRERVGLFGGTLTAGPRPDGGFMVRATLATSG